MAITITSTVTNNHGYTKIVDGKGADYLNLTITSDVPIKYIHYIYTSGEINVNTGNAYGEDSAQLTYESLVDGVYTYTYRILLRCLLSNSVYLELLDEHWKILYYESHPVETYGYVQPEIYAEPADMQYTNSSQTIGSATINYTLFWWPGVFTIAETGKTKSNNVKLVYYYRQAGSGTWSNAVTLKNGVYNSSFISGSFTLSGLAFGTSYQVRLVAYDDIHTEDVYYGTVNHRAINVNLHSKPMFDWGSSDFRFNVPVHLDSNAGIYGIRKDSYGNENPREILACKNGDTYLGYNNIGAAQNNTYICGNKVEFITDNLAINGFNLAGLIAAMSQTYTLPTSISTIDSRGANYNTIYTPSATVKLFGNTLYIDYNATPVGTYIQNTEGDISDFFLGELTINHGGKIADVEDVFSAMSTYDEIAGVRIKGMQPNNDTTVKCTLWLANTGGTVKNVSTTFCIPVTLNLDAYA
jgi:hypothetical protein